MSFRLQYEPFGGTRSARASRSVARFESRLAAFILSGTLSASCSEHVRIDLLESSSRPLEPADSEPSSEPESNGNADDEPEASDDDGANDDAVDDDGVDDDGVDDDDGSPSEGEPIAMEPEVDEPDVVPDSDAADDDGLHDNDAGPDGTPAEPVDSGPVVYTEDELREALSAALIHHYPFSGVGTLIEDIVGNADGEAIGGTELTDTGRLLFDGEDDYVNLPNGLLSNLHGVTIATWLEWHGGTCWQRVFDFGSSVDGEDIASYADTSLFVTPSNCSSSHIGTVLPNLISAQFHVRGQAYMAQTESELAQGDLEFLTVSAAPETGLRVYANGVEAASLPAPLEVSQVDDVNNWLGRSQWVADAFYLGYMDEVRIYDRALTAAEVNQAYLDGPVE